MSTLRRLLLDDRGGETLEYAMILGLFAFATLTAVTSASTSLAAMWDTIRESLKHYLHVA